MIMITKWRVQVSVCSKSSATDCRCEQNQSTVQTDCAKYLLLTSLGNFFPEFPDEDLARPGYCT